MASRPDPAQCVKRDRLNRRDRDRGLCRNDRARSQVGDEAPQLRVHRDAASVAAEDRKQAGLRVVDVRKVICGQGKIASPGILPLDTFEGREDVFGGRAQSIEIGFRLVQSE